MVDVQHLGAMSRFGHNWVWQLAVLTKVYAPPLVCYYFGLITIICLGECEAPVTVIIWEILTSRLLPAWVRPDIQ